MAFPNTHAFAFTQLPRSLTKTWSKQSFQGDNLISYVPNSAKHRNCVVSKITLSIDYDKIQDFSNDTFDGSEDRIDDAIDLWKENRNLWKELEMAVENVIAKYGQQVKLVLKQQGKLATETYDVPCKGCTLVSRHDEPRTTQDSPTIAPGSVYDRTLVTLSDDAESTYRTTQDMLNHPAIKEQLANMVNSLVNDAVQRVHSSARRRSDVSERTSSSSQRSKGDRPRLSSRK